MHAWQLLGFVAMWVVPAAISIGQELSADEFISFPPPELKLAAVDGANASSVTTTDDKTRSLTVRRSDGIGAISLDTSFIRVSGATKYKAAVRFSVDEFTYGSFVNVLVREYADITQRPKAPYHVVLPEWRIVAPTRDGRSSARIVHFETDPATVAITISIVISGNPTTLTFNQVEVGPEMKENRDRAPRELPPILSREEMLAVLEKRPASSAKIVTKEGRVRVEVDGTSEVPVFHQAVYWDPQDRLHDAFAKAGVRIHVIPIQFGPYRMVEGKIQPGVWVGDNEYNFAYADESIELALRADPNLMIIPGLSLIPYASWGDKYPDEIAQNEKGERAVGSQVHNIAYRNQRLDMVKEFWCPSLFSDVYREETLKAVAAWFEHAKGQPYYKSIVGIMMYGGDDGQWGHWQRSGPLNRADYSPAGRAAFKRWIQEKYKTNEALQDAWYDDKVTLETVQPPTVAQRRIAERVFLDPTLDQPAIDYFQFATEEKSRTIVFFGEGIKRLAGKPILVGSYYGDSLYGRRNNLWAEHIRRSSDALDFFVSPLDYGPYRSPGLTGGVSAVVSSLRLHNKLFLEELDLRTEVSRYSNENYERNVIGRLDDAQDFNAVNRRETGLMAALRQSQWYYTMAGGSFYSPYAIAGVAEAVKVRQALATSDASAFRPDVAVFADEASAKYLSDTYHNRVIFPSTSGQRSALFASGVPFDLYDAADLMHPDLRDYKVYVFLNSYYLSPHQRQHIETKLKRGGKVLVWMHAAGYVTDKALSVKALSSTVGMNIRIDPTIQSLDTISVDGSEAPFNGLRPYQGGLVTEAASIRCIVEDPAAIAFGRYVAGGQVSSAVKKHSDWTSVYIGKPGGLGPDLLNRIAKLGGAFVAAEPGDVVAMSGDLVMVHALSSGDKEIRLPFKADVTDLITGQAIAEDAERIRIPVQVNETRLLGLKRK